ncbi:MAG: glycosyltransferase family 2 protein [bacterium]
MGAKTPFLSADCETRDFNGPSVDERQACLGVVIPCFNEASTVDVLIRRVLSQPAVQEVVAVDDGSTDETWECLRRWPARDSRVRALRHRCNRGKGAALRSGFKAANAAVVVVQDADLEYDPADYAEMLEVILSNSADVVYGSRFHPQTQISSPRWHRWGNWLITQVANGVTGLQLSDEATCYKMFRRSLLDQFDLREDGFGFCPEFTVKAARMGMRIREVPVTYRNRTWAQGKKIRLRHGIEALGCLLRYRFFGRCEQQTRLQD